MLKNEPKSKTSSPYREIGDSAKVGEVTKDEETSFESEELSSSNRSDAEEANREDSPAKIEKQKTMVKKKQPMKPESATYESEDEVSGTVGRLMNINEGRSRSQEKRKRESLKKRVTKKETGILSKRS